uniref:Mini-chromosome maintenance complex-binding protein n=1 Tax=Romanomermis culicivorax TaxID=13658 RepID=A0A915KDJ2_ROMCU
MCVENKESCSKLLMHLADCIDDQFSGMGKYTIPSLNMKNSKDMEHGSLVRFRCMIQDMFDPEMLPSCLKIASGELKPIVLRDMVDFTEENCTYLDNDATFLIYRYVFNCIPVPGESFWFKHELFKTENVLHSQDQPAGCSNIDNIKRPPGSGDETSLEDDTLSCKRFRDDSSTPASNQSIEKNQDSYLVKVYSDGDTFKLNDVVEFIGILSKNEADLYDPTLYFRNGREKHSLHVIKAQILSSFRSFHDIGDDQTKQENVEQSRKLAVDYLKGSLSNDELAAEYLLCNLICSTIRKELLILAKFTLNLYNVDSDQADKICNCLSLIYPKVQYLPLRLDILNKESLVPRKDYESNCLETARLQLSSGTLLIVDETKLTSGQLNEQGIKNIAALKTLIVHQKLDYDFVYHGVEFPTDLNILVLSEGISCLSNDYALPLNKSLETLTLNNDIRSLNVIRQYLMNIRSTDFTIEDSVQEIIRDDFVNMRRNEASVDQTRLHELLSLARWLNCSIKTQCLTESTWKKAKDMESARRARMKLVP